MALPGFQVHGLRLSRVSVQGYPRESYGVRVAGSINGLWDYRMKGSVSEFHIICAVGGMRGLASFRDCGVQGFYGCCGFDFQCFALGANTLRGHGGEVHPKAHTP